MTGGSIKKENQDSTFVPILTTAAGRCLTLVNWQEVGIKMAAYDLSALLMKPGFDLLSALPDLATYVGWQGDVVLNASMPAMDRAGGYTLRSEYDGSRRRYTLVDILALIRQLKPQQVILPLAFSHQDKSAWRELPDSVLAFLPAGELPEQTSSAYGVYFHHEAGASFSTLLQRIRKHEGIPCYVDGELSLSMMQLLGTLGVHYTASNLPARDACLGVVYCMGGAFSLTDDTQRLDFGVIDAQCHCPTCEQQLTRAYLHHLFEHAPLLCQRFLIQHNVAVVRSKLTYSFTSASNTDIM